MEALTGYHEKLIDLADDIVTHGFGQMTIDVTSLKDGTVKIVISAGKHWVFFVEKKYDIDNLKNVL